MFVVQGPTVIHEIFVKSIHLGIIVVVHHCTFYNPFGPFILSGKRCDYYLPPCWRADGQVGWPAQLADSIPTILYTGQFFLRVSQEVPSSSKGPLTFHHRLTSKQPSTPWRIWRSSRRKFASLRGMCIGVSMRHSPLPWFQSGSELGLGQSDSAIPTNITYILYIHNEWSDGRLLA